MILIVGDGNFSFSLSLALHSQLKAAEITTTSYEDYKTCIAKYGQEAQSTIENLKSLGCTVLHSVDATKLHELSDALKLNGSKIGRVIFNFPHIGRKAGIKLNRNLLKAFFVSVSCVLSTDGTVEVTLCSGQGGTPSDSSSRENCNHWQVVEMATFGGFVLNQVVPFQTYPGYISTGKRGAGNKFRLQGARTHVFVKSPSLPVFQKDWKISLDYLCESNATNTNHTQLPSCLSRRLQMLSNEAQFQAQMNVFEFARKKLKNDHPSFNEDLCEKLQKLLEVKNWLNVRNSSVAEEHHDILNIYNSVQQFCLNLNEQLPFICCGFVFSPQNFQDANSILRAPIRCEMVIIQNELLPENSTSIPAENFRRNFLDLFKLDSNRFSLTVIEESASSCELYSISATSSNSRLHYKITDNTLDASYTVGYSYLTHNSLVTVLDLDMLTCGHVGGLGMHETSALWSVCADTRARLRRACETGQSYHRRSLYPPSYVFHVSFWVLGNSPYDVKAVDVDNRLPFTEANFIELLRQTCDDLLHSVQLTDIYVTPYVTSFNRDVIAPSPEVISTDLSNLSCNEPASIHIETVRDVSDPTNDVITFLRDVSASSPDVTETHTSLSDVVTTNFSSHSSCTKTTMPDVINPVNDVIPCRRDVDTTMTSMSDVNRTNLSTNHSHSTCNELPSTFTETVPDVIGTVNAVMTSRKSCCYAMTFSSHEFSLSRSDAHRLQDMVRTNLEKFLKVEIR